MLLVFAGSLLGDTASAAYNLYQLSGKAGYEVVWSAHCEGDFSVSHDADREHNHFHLTALPDSDSADSESNRVVINSCSSSLHLMLTGQISLTPPSSETTYSNTVYLPASQLFVGGIADPPQKA